MSINLRNVSVSLPLLLLLLLFIVAGSVPSGFGQNTPPNITTSDIVDLFGNVTDREDGGGENDDSNFPQLNDDGSNNNDSNDNSSSSSASTLSASPSSSSPSSSSSSPSSPSLTTSQTAIMINEIELNPPGEYDEGKEWIELYNPSDGDINISNFEISTSSESAAIKLPPDAIIEAGETYVIELEEQILSNTVDSLILANAAGDIQDRTPSLVDRSDDDRTWQRIPDGNNEWQFVEGTEGNANGDDGDDSDTGITTPDSEENTQGNANDDDDDPDTLSTILDSVYSGSDVAECLGSADCIEGVATRIVDGDTLYVRSNSTVYKVDLALIEVPSRTEEMFAESTAFTRDLCLGSTVLVDQDDMLLTSNSGVIGVVYCSSSNLNSELLDNGYAELDTQQCATSEFANEPWVKDHGC
jgi:endonuclease YncB( thermonuclease family)